MSNADDLDLDSLMELLDDPFEANEKEMSSSSLKLEKDCQLQGDNAVQRTLKDIPLDFSPKKQSPVKDTSVCEKSLLHPKDNDSSEDDEENKQHLTEEGKDLKKKIEQKPRHFDHRPKPKISTWKDAGKAKGVNKSNDKDGVLTDCYSGIRIKNPLISFDVMQQRMQDRKMIKMSFLKNFIRGNDIEGDWVTIGVLIHKLPPKTTKTGKAFSIWKMTDLIDCEKVVSVFLFGAAHTEHWKISVGSVIGFLNPSIMPDNKDKNSETSLSVDHAGKLMQMGTSKDFGHCKGKRRDGEKCNATVNVSQCEYCIYHVKKEYQKFSAKRSELQASYSGREPSLKDKLLKKQNVFYGGQMFTPTEKGKKSNKSNSKDKLTLLNLGLKRKAEALENDEKAKGIKKLADLYGPDILEKAETNSEFINNQLVIPTAGSRNLLQHMKQEKLKKETDNIKVITPKELLKMRDNYQRNKETNMKKSDNNILQNLVPKLGKGLDPGQSVSLDFLSSRKPKAYTAQEFAKLRAIKKIQDKGPIKRQDPNSVKASSDVTAKVKAVLDNSIDELKDYVEEEALPKSKLGTIDLNSDKIKEILNRKSNHAYEVEMAEIEKQETYFNALEKKERMEEKMATTTEIVCDVVSCKQCKYTAHHATDMCKEQRHPLKCHKAIKRFFECKDCKRRTCCFTKFPKRSCRNCNGSNYERTCMLKPRSGPKLDSESLCIRGEEIKFLNSLKC